MEKELMAEFLEDFRGLLASYYMAWMLDNLGKMSVAEMSAAAAFYAYARAEAEADIHAERAGGSYEACRRRRESPGVEGGEGDDEG